MEKKYIVANWKMNPETSAEAKGLLDFMLQNISLQKNSELIICPPFVHLPDIHRKLQFRTNGLRIILGAQNCHWESHGPFTGEISPSMLKQFGVTHVIAGHSERRWKMGETDEMVNGKVRAALEAGLVPIVAVGEKERTNFDSQGVFSSAVEDVLIDQLTRALADIPKSKLKRIIVAYEPVWAISTSGTGLTATPDDALSASLLIRKVLAKLLSERDAMAIPVLYGGSVDSQNAKDFIIPERIQGVLVGGVSLRKEEFTKLVDSV